MTCKEPCTVASPRPCSLLITQIVHVANSSLKSKNKLQMDGVLLDHYSSENLGLHLGTQNNSF